MFEVHGWATIRATPENSDRADEEERQSTAVEMLRSYMDQLERSHNPLASVRWVNGNAHLSVDAFTNHSEPLYEAILDLFRYIALVAPGSYGLLYLHDDEMPGYEQLFRVYVLARGTLTERQDTFLSPFVPIIEDPYSKD